MQYDIAIAVFLFLRLFLAPFSYFGFVAVIRFGAYTLRSDQFYSVQLAVLFITFLFSTLFYSLFLVCVTLHN